MKDIVKGIFSNFPEYTYIRDNYGSRLDRIYVKHFFNNIASWDTIPVSFSDHSMVIGKFNNDNVKIGKGFWRMNVRILDNEEVEIAFKELWNYLASKKNQYGNLLLWWEYVKQGCKCFFKKESRKLSEQNMG